MWDHNPDLRASPGLLRLPLEEEQLQVAKATVADNKGAQWAAAQAMSLQVGDIVGLKYAIGRFLWELEGIPTSTISDMTEFSGQELREIAAADPISLFRCLDCEELILPHDHRHFMRLSREYKVICKSRVGDLVVTDSLCQHCIEARLQLYAEERRVRRLSERARAYQLSKMPFEEYRLTPEWQAKRTQALTRAGYRCQACGERDARLDAHHNSYERYGDENIYDLVVFCHRCHEVFHSTLRNAS
jgi:hypothetical protein